ncbi:hypothetical protein [Streptomyces sp. NPDC007264]|uniref:hypothetical protein n=1 Tax=Streptomyces sp. NPDC007264 TaxID=3364777 RepID=UPI0036DD8445
MPGRTHDRPQRDCFRARLGRPPANPTRNADRELAETARGEFPAGQAWEIDLWAAEQPREEDVKFLAELGRRSAVRAFGGQDGRGAS